MKASIIISVYKNVRALQAVIRSLLLQTEQDFEVIISEDGQDAAMYDYIQHTRFPWPVHHLTQEDIDQLRQFVQLVFAQEEAGPCDARIIPDRQQAARSRIGTHCAKLEDPKVFVEASDSRLPEKYRSR